MLFVYVSSRMLAGKLFHATGPATEKALDPSFVRVLGTSKCPSVAVAGRKDNTCHLLLFFLTLGRYIPEGFKKLKIIIILLLLLLHPSLRLMLCDHSLSFFHSFCHSVNRITDERGNRRQPNLTSTGKIQEVVDWW